MIDQKLAFGFSESFIYNKSDVFPLLQVLILTVVFFLEKGGIIPKSERNPDVRD